MEMIRITDEAKIEIEARGGVVFTARAAVGSVVPIEQFSQMLDALLVATVEFNRSGSSKDDLILSRPPRPFADPALAETRKKFLSAIRQSEALTQELAETRIKLDAEARVSAGLVEHSQFCAREMAWYKEKLKTCFNEFTEKTRELEDARAELVTMTSSRDHYKGVSDQATARLSRLDYYEQLLLEGKLSAEDVPFKSATKGDVQMIKLGSRVRDTYTGFEGVATARTEWLYGCSRIAIQATTLKDGKPLEAEWFDEQRVELVFSDQPRISAASSAVTGGPQDDPKPNADPVR